MITAAIIAAAFVAAEGGVEGVRGSELIDTVKLIQ